MKVGKIIVLNGTSSSGKTSIVHALQQVMDEPYLEAGFDKFLWTLPAKFLKRPLYLDVLDYDWMELDGERMKVLRARRIGFQFVTGMHHAVVALAKAGNNVILDHIFFEPAWLTECAELFEGYWALLVGVRCPLNIIIEREKERGDRTLGIAPGHFHWIHKPGIYDLEVDTSILTALDCAALIKQRIESDSPPQAFQIIREKLCNRGGS